MTLLMAFPLAHHCKCNIACAQVPTAILEVLDNTSGSDLGDLKQFLGYMRNLQQTGRDCIIDGMLGADKARMAFDTLGATADLAAETLLAREAALGFLQAAARVRNAPTLSQQQGGCDEAADTTALVLAVPGQQPVSEPAAPMLFTESVLGYLDRLQALLAHMTTIQRSMAAGPLDAETHPHGALIQSICSSPLWEVAQAHAGNAQTHLATLFARAVENVTTLRDDCDVECGDVEGLIPLLLTNCPTPATVAGETANHVAGPAKKKLAKAALPLADSAVEEVPLVRSFIAKASVDPEMLGKAPFPCEVILRVLDTLVADVAMDSVKWGSLEQLVPAITKASSRSVGLAFCQVLSSVSCLVLVLRGLHVLLQDGKKAASVAGPVPRMVHHASKLHVASCDALSGAVRMVQGSAAGSAAMDDCRPSSTLLRSWLAAVSAALNKIKDWEVRQWATALEAEASVLDSFCPRWNTYVEGKLVEQMVRRNLLDNPNKDKLAPQIEKVKVFIEDMEASARLMRISALVAHPAATDVLIFAESASRYAQKTVLVTAAANIIFALQNHPHASRMAKEVVDHAKGCKIPFATDTAPAT